jgi:hypothetical protein
MNKRYRQAAAQPPDNQSWMFSTICTPTRITPDGSRHIITSKGQPPICGAGREGEEHPPVDLDRRSVCPRCLQKYIRRILEETV